jgi:hypothetical protein
LESFRVFDTDVDYDYIEELVMPHRRATYVIAVVAAAAATEEYCGIAGVSLGE